MPDQIAVYDEHEMPIVCWVADCPYVFHDGRVQPAGEVVVAGHRLDDIVPAPTFLAIPAGWWADCLYTPDSGEPVRESLPVIALEVSHRGFSRGLVLGGDGIGLLDERPARNWGFIGYRLGEPENFTAHGEER